VFRKHARRTLGRQRVGKTLAFYGVKARYRGIEIETVILGVAGDNSRSTAGNFDDIGVGHVSFLLLASVRTHSPHEPLALVGIDYGFVHCVGARNAAATHPNDKQAYRCDPPRRGCEGTSSRWGLLCFAIKSAVNYFGEPKRTGPRTPGRRLNLLTGQRVFWSSSVTQRTGSARVIAHLPRAMLTAPEALRRG
jgi:hypothetical protein